MPRSHIKSQTRVENYQLQYDLIESGAEGVVKVLEQKDFGIENNSRYHVWIKAEVTYVSETAYCTGAEEGCS